MIASDVAPWTITARNLPHHARNPIHTDAGAQAAGFARALVAGVTTYAYMTHPIMVGWGVDWLTGGGADVRFLSPVCQHDLLRLVPRDDDATVVIDAFVEGIADGGNVRASLRAVPQAGPPPSMRAGESLRPREVRLEGEYGTDYGLRAGDDLDT